MATSENYSVNQFHDAAWLCYINGVEIPTMQVNVHFGVWQFATATITLVPHPMLQRIGAEDRLQVALFWLDTAWDPNDPQFRLFGEFEVVGTSYVNSPRGRSFQLQCVSHDQILEQLHFYYISSINDIVESSVGSVPTDPAVMAQTKLMYPMSLFLEGLCASPEEMAALTEGADNSLIEAAKNSPDVLAATMVEVHVGSGIGASTQTMTEQEAKDNGYTDYKIISQPDSVKSVAANKEYFDNFSLSSVGVGEVGKDGQPGTGFIKRPIDFVLNVFKALTAPYSTDPSTPPPQGTLPPTAVGCPGRNFFGRWLAMTKFDKRWVALPKFEDSPGFAGCFPLVTAVQNTQILPMLSEQVGQGVGFSGSAWDLLKEVFSYMYEEVDIIPAPPAVTTKASGDIVSHSRQDGAGLERRIASHVVKPQCVFSIPPVCNIVFPSMIRQYTFQENYITQPTRIYLGDDFLNRVVGNNSAGMSEMVKRLMVTGYPVQVRARLTALNQTANANNKNFLIYPEELFKGPVTSHFNAPPWMYMLEQQEKASNPNAGKPAVTAEEKEVAAINAAVEASKTSVLGSIFDKYAEYEYYRARYAERGGGLSLAFNPFIVPGFPVAIFDQKYSGFNTMGYVNSVDHNWSAGGGSPSMDTEVGLTFLRTMPEFMSILADPTSASASGKVVADIAPTEVIPSVAAIMQIIGPANDFYSKLFFRNQKMSKPAIFNWKSMVTMRRYDGVTIDPKVDSEMSKCSQDMTVLPRPEYESFFDSYDAAMNFVSRPACTLSEYVLMWHGANSITDLKKAKILQGESRSFYSSTKDRKNTKGAIYWGRIYMLKAGPGTDPGITVTNVGPPSTDPNVPGFAPGESSSSTWAQTKGLPETRKNWDVILRTYRKIVRGDGGNIVPQK